MPNIVIYVFQFLHTTCNINTPVTRSFVVRYTTVARYFLVLYTAVIRYFGIRYTSWLHLSGFEIGSVLHNKYSHLIFVQVSCCFRTLQLRHPEDSSNPSLVRLLMTSLIIVLCFLITPYSIKWTSRSLNRRPPFRVPILWPKRIMKWNKHTLIRLAFLIEVSSFITHALNRLLHRTCW